MIDEFMFRARRGIAVMAMLTKFSAMATIGYVLQLMQLAGDLERRGRKGRGH